MVEVVPSPNCHAQPVAFFEASVKVTLRGASPEAGSRLKSADVTGTGATTTSLEMVEFFTEPSSQVFATVRLTAYVPALK
jgi:hypothetical protein